MISVEKEPEAIQVNSHDEVMEQLKTSQEDPIFQRMEKATQGDKQLEKTVSSSVRRHKRQKTQDRRESIRSISGHSKESTRSPSVSHDRRQRKKRTLSPIPSHSSSPSHSPSTSSGRSQHRYDRRRSRSRSKQKDFKRGKSTRFTTFDGAYDENEKAL